jgi:class 3 adenylate cyclase
LGERYSELLNEIRGILRAAVSRAKGREVDARGDEFFAVFEVAANAIEAATNIQRTLAQRRWPDSLDVRVRIGIHSGRTTLTDVGYIGIAVHTAARVCSAGHGRQILLSGETVTALENAALPGIRFRDLGRHKLAGLPAPEAIFQVDAEGLPDIFPPPRTAQVS